LTRHASPITTARAFWSHIRSNFSLYVMHPVDLYMRLHDVLYTIYEVTGHLSEGLCV